MSLPASAEKRMRRMLRSTWQGSLGGELLSAEPVFSGSGAMADDAGGSTDDSGDTSGSDQWQFERKVLTAAGAQTYQLTYVPVEESLTIVKSGLTLDETVDYTVAWDTGLVSFLAAPLLKIGDVVTFRYVTSGDITVAIQDTAQVLTTLVDFNSSGWKYLSANQTLLCATDGVEDTSLAWTDPAFDDSAWSTGGAPIGWGYSGTSFTPRNTNITQHYELWMRHTFPAGPYDGVITVTAKIDNYGFLYLNGHRIDGPMASGCFVGADNGTVLTPTIDIPQDWINDSGLNVIALHVQDQLTGYGPGDILLGDVKVQVLGS